MAKRIGVRSPTTTRNILARIGEYLAVQNIAGSPVLVARTGYVFNSYAGGLNDGVVKNVPGKNEPNKNVPTQEAESRSEELREEQRKGNNPLQYRARASRRCRSSMWQAIVHSTARDLARALIPSAYDQVARVDTHLLPALDFA